jgi:exoribonuclease II
MSPPRRVIAFERRGMILLGAVEEEGDPLRVIAEGGGQVKVAESHVLRTMAAASEGGTPKEIGNELRRRRLDCEEGVDLELLWELAPEDATVALDDLLTLWCGEPTDESTVALVRSLEGALPWFTPTAGGLTRNARAVVTTAQLRRENEQRAREAEGALISWLENDPTGDAPDGCEPMLEELRRLALAGTENAPKRAIRITRKIGCPEPDDLLEKLEEAGLLPRHVDPGPRRWRVRTGFPADLDLTLESAPDGTESGRVDLTDLFTIALDDPETVEVDDALSWEEADEGILLHVHIADVAARISRGSPLDDEAVRRGRTVYEPDRRIPMMPPSVVPHLSLEENVVRPALTGTFHVAPDGEVRSALFRETLVRVDRRSGYDAAGPDLLGPLTDAGRALRARRVADGAICLDLPDAKFVIVDGVPGLKIRRPSTPGDLVVSEAAVLYNSAVADVLAGHGAAGIFRSQGALETTLPGPDDPLRILKARRSLPPADAALDPARHHGIAADRYVMATSPIRRHVDLIHQRQLTAILRDEEPAYGRGDVQEILVAIRECEHAARMVEGERNSYWLGRLLEARVGEELETIVSRTMPGGRVGVWFEEILRELTLRLPRGHPPTPEGAPLRVKIVKVRPRRGSIHLEVVPKADA